MALPFTATADLQAFFSLCVLPGDILSTLATNWCELCGTIDPNLRGVGDQPGG